MSFDKVDNIMYFSDYRSFFRFVNDWDGNLIIRKSQVFYNDKLIAVFNHKEKVSK